MNATRCHPLPFPVKAVLDGLFRVNMECFERLNLLPISQCSRPPRIHMVRHPDNVTRLPLRHHLYFPFAYLVALGVKSSWKKEKRRVSERKPLASFVNAPFAEENGLPT